MSEKPVVCKVNQIEGKIGHGGAVNVKILVDDLTCGAKNFSFLVNTMAAGLNCNQTGSGHSHEEEHCMFCLSGTGGISVEGEKIDIEPNTMVYVPPGAMHFVWANEGEDFTYIIVYAPAGPEKAL